MKSLLSKPPFPGLLFVLTFAAAIAADRPNILWLTSEDHGQQMGCYGDALARTPNVDALAARGMIYPNAWSVHPVCAPARTALISGLYGESSGGLHMRSMVPMPAGIRMYPEFLREAGYYCTNNSKEDYNLPKTAATWDDSSPRAHWRNRAAGQPFFAIFNSIKSHESQLRVPHTLVTDPAKVRVPAYHPDTPEVRHDWARYYDIVSLADADAGAQLRALAEAGLAEDTIVFYYGDHGSGMPRSKRWPSDSGLRVPLVVYFPEKWKHLAPADYAPGGRSDRPVSFVDLAPTLLSIAGIAPPEWMQGRAFAGSKAAPAREFNFGSRGRMDECIDIVRTVTDGRYVYLRNYFPHVSQGQHIDFQFETPTTRIWRARYDAGQTTPAQAIFWQTPKAPEELYDLSADPDEVHNLAANPAHRAILEKLRAAQRAHAAEIRDVGFLPEGEMRARAGAGSPYDLAHDDAKYPFAKILAAADLASNLDPAAAPALRKRFDDPDSAVRWWAALGHLMRGPAAVTAGKQELRAALNDTSPYVRIAAAQALALHGGADELAPALAALRELASPQKRGFFVAHAALDAIESLGSRAGELRSWAAALSPECALPDKRYDTYLVAVIKKLQAPPTRP